MTAPLCQRVFLCVTFVDREPILLHSVVFQYFALPVENSAHLLLLWVPRAIGFLPITVSLKRMEMVCPPGQPTGSVPASYRHSGRL